MEEESLIGRLVEKRFKAYEEKCLEEIELVDEALGRPHITIDIALPEGCEEMREEFEKLPEDEDFIKELQDFIREFLAKKLREIPSD